MSGRVDGENHVVITDLTSVTDTLSALGKPVDTSHLTVHTHLQEITLHAPGTPRREVTEGSVPTRAGGTYISIPHPNHPVAVATDAPTTVTVAPDTVDITTPQQARLRVLAPQSPSPQITVSPSASGLATAISTAITAPLVSGPSRSHPRFRAYPPPISIGDTDHVPAPVQTLASPTATIQAPPDSSTLLQLAPLAYYLDATITVTPDTDPVLNVHETDSTLSLTPIPETPRTLLETAFRIDCLLRTHHQPTPPPPQTTILQEIDIDLEPLFTASPSKRLLAYQTLDTDHLLSDTPPWHLATYVSPTPSMAQALPLLLDRLSQIFEPAAKPLEPQTLMERSLDDFYRSSRPTATVDLLEPTLQPAAAHAWLADDIPVDAFKLPHHVATRNGSTHPQSSSPLSITLIVNDPAMLSEEDTVAQSYRQRAAVPIELTRHRELSRDELETALTAHSDLLHFIGHCEPDGLVCPDGYLSTDAVTSVGARLVFLNACGSYHEGASLVDNGATAAAITYRGVLDGQAETVGTAFARLVTRGFAIERTVSMARRRVMMGMDYGVIGDGTHRLTGAVEPIRYVIEPTETAYEVTCETFADGIVGDVLDVPLPEVRAPQFRGDSATQRLSTAQLESFLESTTAPILYEGSFAWPGDLISTITADNTD